MKPGMFSSDTKQHLLDLQLLESSALNCVFIIDQAIIKLFLCGTFQTGSATQKLKNSYKNGKIRKKYSYQPLK